MKLSDRLKRMWRGADYYDTVTHLRNVLAETRHHLLLFGCYAKHGTSIQKLAKAAAEYVAEIRAADPTRARIVQQRLELRKLHVLLTAERLGYSQAHERGRVVGIAQEKHRVKMGLPE